MSHLDRDPWVDVKTFTALPPTTSFPTCRRKSGAGTPRTPPCWGMR
jgi:hypothetical protein